MRDIIDRGVNTPLTSSAGRLFDAVAALLSLRLEVSFEGQAAVLLETAARRHFATQGLPGAASEPPWLREDDWAPPTPPGTTRGGTPPRILPLAPFARAVVRDLD